MAKKPGKTKKRLRIDTYDPVIYPRLLFVCKNATLNDLRKRFVCRDGDELDDEWDPVEGTFTLYVKDRTTDLYGVLINLADWALKSDKLINNITHEAEHAKISIFEDCHLDTDSKSQEADAYLIGWIAQCVYNTVTK